MKAPLCNQQQRKVYAETTGGIKNQAVISTMVSLSLSLSGYKVLSLLEMPSSDTGSIDQADAYVHITFIKKWDICAGAALLNALGNVITIVILSLVSFPVSNSIFY